MNQQEVGKPKAKANWFLLGHTSQFPLSSWFSSVFASLAPGTWPEDFHREKELLCSPNPSPPTRTAVRVPGEPILKLTSKQRNVWRKKLDQKPPAALPSRGDEANASLHGAQVIEDTEEVTQKDFKPYNILFIGSRKSTEEKPPRLCDLSFFNCT